MTPRIRACSLLLALGGLAAMNSAPADTPSAGCKSPLSEEGSSTFTFEGVTRPVRLVLPHGDNSSGKPAPLVLFFHGWGGGTGEFLGDESLVALAREKGYALAASQGLGRGAPDESNSSWTFRGSGTGVDGSGGAICDTSLTPDYSYASCSDVRKNTCSWTQCQQDDVEFTLAMLDHLLDNYCLDEDRVFAVGGSNGGMFTWELGQNPKSAARLRAIAPIIGLPHRGYLDGPGRSGSLPALLVTSSNDPVVPPGEWESMTHTTTSNDNDRFYYASASAISARWAQAHGCEKESPAGIIDTGAEGVDCRSYCSTEDGLPPVMDCRAPMGHNYDMDWVWPLTLRFFDQY